MTTPELLSYLRGLGVELWSEGERLRINAPAGVLTPAMREQVATRKAEILTFLDRASRSTSGVFPSSPQLVPVPCGSDLPLSFAQQRLWFLDQLQPGSPAYNIPAALRLEGRLRTGVLAAALAEIVRRHEVLRTTFPADGSEPAQSVAPPDPIPLPVLDLSGLPSTAGEVDRLVREEARHPFDLARGPLLRARLLRLGTEEHIALVTMHHVVSDGWSMGVMIRELGILYRAFSRGEPSPLAELPVQYGDFASWQRSWLRGEVLESEIAWWRAHLRGAPPVLELPTDRPRPLVQRHRGSVVPVRLPTDLSSRIGALARNESATPFMALLSAFEALLHRYSGQDDVVVGTPIAGRNQVETEGLIGFFVNTLVLRGDLSADPSFRDLLSRTREVTLEAYRHQDVPFEKLVEELRPERSLSHTPLFQVMFALQNVPQEVLELEGLRLSPVRMETGIAKFDLLLTLAETRSGILGTLEYSTDLFEVPTVYRMVSHFERLLESAVSSPESRISELSLLGVDECHQVLREWNDSGYEHLKNQCLHWLFERQVDRAPDRAAVVFGEETLSYRELDEQANQVARALRRRGVGPEVLVGLCLERSLELVVGLFGILKAGGAYVPLDPEYPRERLLYMLEDAGVPVVVTQGRYRELFSEALCLDEDGEEIGRESRCRPDSGVCGDNAAYVMYTSGSTGRPKGAVIRHAGITSHMQWMQRDFPMGPEDSVIQKTPISFDASVWEFYASLYVGGRLVMARPGGHREPGYLAREIARQGVTTFQVVPSLLRAFLEEPGLESCSALRWLICGGESLDGDLVHRFFERLPGDLVNVYGPAESSITASFWFCRGDEPAGSPVTIGRSIANVQIHILGRHLELLPAGVPGELFIAGVGVGRGYLGRPSLTAERFVPDPFSDAGARMYRTGDLVKRLADGRLEFLGRVDHQVKVRGVRIELGEVESALLRHPGVKQAVVLVREDRIGDRRLVGYVVSRGNGLKERDLRSYLQDSLPEYMMPSAFVVLDSLPLNPSGKVDRGALPVPVLGSGEAYVAPRTALEEGLASIWSDVLHVEKVGVEDHFFSLGGHSLLATRIVSRIRQTFGVDLPLREMFESPTVDGLAGKVERLLAESPDQVAPPIRPVPQDADPPLSFAQQRLWFIDQLQPGSPAYNIAAAFRLRGDLRISVLAPTIGEIVRRHEVLRTAFPAVGGEPIQAIEPPRPLSLSVIDLGGLAPDRKERESSRLIAEEGRRPFELDRGPLFRVLLLRLGHRDHAVAVTLHHIVSDGWSMGILVRELVEIYRAYHAGRSSPLPELPVQYADFSWWQRLWLRGEVLDREVRYWRQQLAGAPPVLTLPTDRPRPAVQSFRGAARPLRLGERLSAVLGSLALGEGATLFMVLLTAFQVLMGRYSAQEDLSVGTPIAGRNRIETEGLIGFFVNTLVIRGDLAGDPAFRDLLGRVREVTLEAYRHQDLPFERLVEELRPERSLSHSPLFQVVLLLQNVPMERLELADLTLSPLPADTGIAKFDLVLTLAEVTGGLAGALQYSTDLFDASTVDRMLGHFTMLLQGAVHDPDGRLSSLPLLTPAERRQILDEWSRPWCENDREACLHELFEEQAERTPDEIAVRFEGRNLTYRELDDWSNRLARSLCRLGVGPEARVGICLERSLEIVAGILGVLKAGGAYLPLDPAYPRSHLASILEEARPVAVLSQKAWAGSLPPEAGEVLLLDGEPPPWEGEGAEAQAGQAEPGNLAYLIYTSGSTGRPKGVMIPHGAICNHLLSRQVRHPLGTQDRFLQQAPFSFEMSVWEIFSPLIAGARLVMARPGGQRDPAYLVRVIAEEGITALRFAPSMLRVFLEEEGVESCRELRHVFSGAESLPVELVERFRARLPGRLHHLYGPTETCVAASIFVGEPEPSSSKLPIGRSLAGADLHLLGPRLEMVPVGVPGELYIGGRGVARGYLALPALTAERFVPHPFGDRPGERLYRTGDLVRWLPDGNLDFIGRVDHQVKVRGFRVEPGGIEVILSQHPAVREAVVLAHGLPSDVRLTAYLVADSGVSNSDLRTFLRERLPDYMVPSALVRMEQLPRTRNGKVDRDALPPQELAQPEPETALAAPRTQAEEVVAAIWAQVLGRREIGIHDNFFDLGGHSLLATQVMSRIRRAFGLELPLRALFEAPTVSGLAEALDALAASGALPIPPLAPVPRHPETRLPLSFAQQRLWFIHQLQPDSPAYNVPAALRMQGDLSIPALQGALGEVVRRHEVLRTAYPAVGGEPAQAIAPPAPVPLPIVDLSGLPSAGPEMELLVRESARSPFDLSTGPLFRVALLRLQEDDHVAFLGMHHIVSDGWSVGLLIREMAALYRASPLAELPVQYGDFASWQRSWLHGEALESEIAWWREHLRGAPPMLELPTDRPRPLVQTHRGSVVPVRLPVDLSSRIGELARGESATPFMTLLSVFEALLHRYSGQDDVVVGTPIAGRNQVETEGLIGFFVNTLVLRGDLSADPAFRDLLSRTREVTLEAYRHQDVPFEKLVEELRPERSLSHTPLFQVMFALQNVPQEVLELEGLRLSPVRMETGIAKFDLLLTLAETRSGIMGTLEYSADLFEVPTVCRLVSHFERLLESAVSSPESRVSDLSLLGIDECHQVLWDWNDSGYAHLEDQCLHWLFERQVDRAPDRVAVVFGEESLSYRELDERANQVARALRRRGVGPEVLVGLCLERSLELVVGLFGILKSGGAYVPLDPEYPRERLLYMLEDAGVPVVVTQVRYRELFSEVLCLDEDFEEIGRESRSRPDSGVCGDNAAYVMYTSGSTGRPKGAVIHHAGITSHMQWMQRDFPMGPEDSVIQKTPISFDASVWEFYAPLYVGGRLVMARPGGHREPGYLAREISRQGVTTFQVVPSLLRAFLEEPGVEACSTLRWLICGGESLDGDLVHRFFKRLPGDLVNVYGPAESSITASFWFCRGDEPPGSAVTIGRSIANVQIHILGRRLELLPAGVPGELFIAGVGVGRGYLGRPSLTAERFLPDPFREPGARMYRTGDLVRRLPDGRLEFLGRVDHQVKVRGVRIELGEVESALLRHPGVEQAVALVREDAAGDRRLVGYVVSRGNGLEPRDLRTSLQSSLPEYMMPSVLVVLDSLPLNPSGKVDRSALPAPVLGSGEAYVAPRTEVEEGVASIWSAVLGVEKVGVEDNFFSLGGHSLLATRIVSRIRQTFGIDLPLRELFESPTVASVAEIIEATCWSQRAGAPSRAFVGEEREELEL